MTAQAVVLRGSALEIPFFLYCQRKLSLSAEVMKVFLSLLASALAIVVASAASSNLPVPVPTEDEVPKWPKPTAVTLGPGSPTITCKDITMVHSTNSLGGFEIRVADKPMAIGQNRPMIGYVKDGHLRWLDLAQAPSRKLEVGRFGDSLTVYFECSDMDGGRWIIDERFTPLGIGPAISFRIRITSEQERAVAYLPMFEMFPGANSFGSVKGQALLPGLEYLENEPSSSEADVIGPASKRQVPDNLKLTMPLMAIQNDGRFVAISWDPQTNFCALFDTPDRIFASGSHVMGILYPGSDGKNRKEGSLISSMAEWLPAHEPVVLSGVIVGGRGESVVPALQHYVGTHVLPAINIDAMARAYFPAAAGGWLDSKIREGSLFHHAIAGGNFPAQPAADAAVWMDLLARQIQQPGLLPHLQPALQNSGVASRLHSASTELLRTMRPEDYNVAAIGHVRFPNVALLYGHVDEALEQARQQGRSLLERFDANLAVKYRPAVGKVDYGKTHFSDEANGVTSRAVLDLLEAAAFCGDDELLEAGLKRLGAMDKFSNGVPRGAQTWECPLHTPDILASAQMTRAYTLGFELTGDTNWLAKARYWAWTGVPFVYLVNPTEQPVGTYATIAVFGATNWKQPVWLGLPVQWCGLVYADALYRLAAYDSSGPWLTLADGITASGIEQSWPVSDSNFQGLLPDSFNLRTQHRNGPAINPATLEACALRLFGWQRPLSELAFYNFQCFWHKGVRVHAPGKITEAVEYGSRIRFGIRSMVEHPYFVLINGLKQKPQLKIDGNLVDIIAPHEFREKEGVLILKLQGKPMVELE
jgi:hypothetical protein